MKLKISLFGLALSSIAHALPASEMPRLFVYKFRFREAPKQGEKSYVRRAHDFMKKKNLLGSCVDLGLAPTGDGLPRDEQHGVSIVSNSPLKMADLLLSLCGSPDCQPAFAQHEVLENMQVLVQSPPRAAVYENFAANVMSKFPSLAPSCQSGNYWDSYVRPLLMNIPLNPDRSNGFGGSQPLDITYVSSDQHMVTVIGKGGKMYQPNPPPRGKDATDSLAPAGGTHGAEEVPTSPYENPYTM